MKELTLDELKRALGDCCLSSAVMQEYRTAAIGKILDHHAALCAQLADRDAHITHMQTIGTEQVEIIRDLRARLADLEVLKT